VDARNLNCFLTIAELGSVNRAADALGIAQPTLSQQLLRMEDEVGVKLFRRTTRGMVLTEAGRIFQEHAMRLLVSWTRALEDVRQFHSQPSGNVSLAMPPSISRMVGVPLVQAVIGKAPQISLRLVEALSGSIRPWLDSGTIDLGILHDGGTLRHLSKRRFAREEIFLVGPPGLLGPSRDHIMEVSFGEIANYPLIAPSLQHGLRSFLDREALRLGFNFTISHEIDAISHIVTLVSSGCGFSILPLPSVAEELAAGKVSIARIGDGTISRSLCLVRNSSQVITHASVVVEDILLNILGELVASGKWDAVLEKNPV
jgi:LysR family transcriptional regulator, nitrogen assimilation regulatory protein